MIGAEFVAIDVPAVREVTVKKALALLLLDVAAVGAAAMAVLSGGQAPRPEVSQLLRSLDEIDAGSAWPGFSLTDWPVAVFDGTETFLVRHPSPPPGFGPLADWPIVRVYPGRYRGVAGNSSAEIGGTRTATVVAGAGPANESARLAYVEEVFHVFWLRRHADFRPNEMARYSYPIKDPHNLERVLAEDEALARAVEARDAHAAAAWAATAFRLRGQRAGLLTADDRAFETGLEMMEGIANYVARSVVGLQADETAKRLRDERTAEQIRWRYYDSGTAICLLLDRLEPGWKARIDAEPGQTTLALLEGAVRRDGAGATPFSPAEMAGFENRAVAAIAELSARQGRVRAELDARAGFRIVVDVAEGASPFRASRFDPINLLVLDAGEVVHPRSLTLSGPAGTVELANPSYSRGSFTGLVGITTAAGRHPLATGVRRLLVVGLADVPKVDREGGALVISADGVRIVLRNADVRVEGETLFVRVSGATPSGGERDLPRGTMLLQIRRGRVLNPSPSHV